MNLREYLIQLKIYVKCFQQFSNNFGLKINKHCRAIFLLQTS